MKILFLLLTISVSILPSTFAMPDKDEIIDILKEYSNLNQQFIEAFDKKEFNRQKEIGKQIDSLHLDKFLPALNVIESIFCDTKDKDILDTYVDMLKVIGHSASEAPRSTFGGMMFCHPDMVLDAVRTSDNKEQLISDLRFGFESLIHAVDTTKLDIDNLRIKINELD